MGAVLVTGAAGFIGSHLVERLLTLGEQVVGLDDFNDYYDPALKERNLACARVNPAFALVRGDIRDADLVSAVLRDRSVSSIVHLAARPGVRPSVQNPALYVDVNVHGTLNLLRRAGEARVSRFVFASSSSVYGLSRRIPFREDDPLGLPASPYAASKIAGEAYCHVYHDLSGMPVTVLRFFSVYGPRQRPDMAIHKFVKRIMAGEEIVLFGDGCSKRDHTFIDDIIDGVAAALNRCRGYEVYNLGNSKVVSLKRLVEVIEQACGKKVKIAWQPDQPGDVPITFADVSKAQRDLGYSPATDIEAGVQRFVEWYREEQRARDGRTH
jgi:UDP-glucuronate 4-epimerase